MYVTVCDVVMFVFFFKQKTAYEMRISDWSADVCSSDLRGAQFVAGGGFAAFGERHGGAQRIGLRLGLFGLAARLVRFVGEHQRREQQLAHLGAALDAAGFFVDQRRELDKLLLLPVGAMDVIGPSGYGQANVSQDRKSTRLHSSHYCAYRLPFSALKQK